jgi:hypothetical protein
MSRQIYLLKFSANCPQVAEVAAAVALSGCFKARVGCHAELGHKPRARIPRSRTWLLIPSFSLARAEFAMSASHPLRASPAYRQGRKTLPRAGSKFERVGK